MKKPYIKKFCELGKFKVFIVDGPWARKNLCEDFINFGQPLHFKFIPKNEFWIEKEYVPGEEIFVIDHMLTEYNLMKKRISYNKAYQKAAITEKRERKKALLTKKIKLLKSHKEEIIKKVKKKKLKEYSKDINIWLVNGELVRDILFIEFAGGGHDKVYHFIPDKEIWLDDDISSKERKFILVHELHERNLMSRGLNYSKAHKKATLVEHFCRLHPKQINKIINREQKAQKYVIKD